MGGQPLSHHTEHSSMLTVNKAITNNLTAITIDSLTYVCNGNASINFKRILEYPTYQNTRVSYLPEYHNISNVRNDINNLKKLLRDISKMLTLNDLTHLTYNSYRGFIQNTYLKIYNTIIL